MDGSTNYLIESTLHKLILIQGTAKLTSAECELLDKVINIDLVKLQAILNYLSNKELNGKAT